MKRLFTALPVLLTLLSTHSFGQSSRRALPDDNLAYPILITLRNGTTGSGFYVNTGAGSWMVTAKHVLFDLNTGSLLDSSFVLMSYSKDLSDPTPLVVTVDIQKAGPNAIAKHPTEDVAVMLVFSENTRAPGTVVPTPGVTIQSIPKAGILGVGTENITKFKDVLVGNEVIVMGYPTSLGLQNMPEIDTRRPLLRKGAIAGVNAKTRSIILDCPVYFGNSGGPVIEVDPEGLGFHFRVVGVVSKYVPYADGGKTFIIMANSGYSIITPMDFVMELIK